MPNQNNQTNTSQLG